MNNEEIMLEDDEEDQLILALGEAIMEQKTKLSFLSFRRMAQIMQSYKIIEAHLMDEGMVLSYSLHDGFASVGVITIEGEEMWFVSSDWLHAALRYASNMEIYPLVNGKVRMALTFYGLTQTIG